MLHVTSMPGSSSILARADLHDQVYASLKEALATRKLAPGEKLSLQELATAYGVSRSPVQQALTRLVSEGLVEVKPHLGHFVRPMTAASVCEAYDVREALELWVAEQTVGRISPGELAELRRLMERTLEMLEGRRIIHPGGYIATNQAFHDYLVGLAGNELLRESYRRLSVNALMARVLTEESSRESNVAAEHVELVEAFEAGNLARVGAAIRVHVETGKRLAREAIEQAGGVL
jgi:4-nitrophenol 2-monooxygenase / 4-nitrocatechol 4-monooxygenase, reductase component